MNYPCKIDLHIHTAVSDGTDLPSEMIDLVKNAGIELFSVTDHDSVKSSVIIQALLKEGDPAFITGVEFSCKDEEGQYHILGYGYNAQSPSIRDIVAAGHSLRVSKLKKRLTFLKNEFGFSFSGEDIKSLYVLDNPGKPHIGNLMVKYGYASTKEEAIRQYINKFHAGSEYIRPKDAIKAILDADGIPILAHPSYGRGDEILTGDDMDKRLRKLIGYGLCGVEAFYSGFTPKLQEEILSFAERYELYVTAGSDYHGKNKMVKLGDTNFESDREYPEGMLRFLDAVMKKR